MALRDVVGLVVLERLRAQLAECEKRIADEQSRAQKLQIAIEVLEEDELSSLNERAPPADKAQKPQEHLGFPIETLQQTFRGKSIADAAIAMLRLTKRPMSELELIDALKAGGVIFVSPKPQTGFRFTLVKKKRENGLIEEAPGQRWKLIDPDEKIRETSDTTPGYLPNRDPVDHVARSREGLAAAKKRGVRLGSRGRLTDQSREQIIKDRASGMSVADIATKHGVTRAYVYKLTREDSAISSDGADNEMADQSDSGTTAT